MLRDWAGSFGESSSRAFGCLWVFYSLSSFMIYFIFYRKDVRYVNTQYRVSRHRNLFGSSFLCGPSGMGVWRKFVVSVCVVRSETVKVYAYSTGD